MHDKHKRSPTSLAKQPKPIMLKVPKVHPKALTIPVFMNPQGYLGSLVPDWLMSRKTISGNPLSANAKLLYGYLARRYNDEYECAWPGQKDIAAHLGVSVRWVRKLVRELRDHRLIRVERRLFLYQGWTGPRMKTLYEFLQHPVNKTARKTRDRAERDLLSQASAEEQDDE